MRETEITDKKLKQPIISEPQNAILQANTPRILNMAGQGGGKSFIIGYRTAEFISRFPKLKGFIAANTNMQLSTSTMAEVFKVWKDYFGWEEYDKDNPNGVFVSNKMPPKHFKTYHKLDRYNNTISFLNGCLVFTGSLENYKAHDGKEFGWAHLDETKDTKEEAINTVIVGRIRQRGLWIKPCGTVFFDDTISNKKGQELNYISWGPMYIHTSPASGQIDWLIKMFRLDGKEREIKNTLMDEYKYYHYADQDVTAVLYQSFWNEENLGLNYISSRMATLTEQEKLKFIYSYPFAKSGGEAFKEWNRTKSIKKWEVQNDNGQRHLCFDFNVVPYLTMLDLRIEHRLMFYCKTTKDHYEDPLPGREPIMTAIFYAYKEYPMKSPNNGTAQAAQHYNSILDSEFNSPSEVMLNIYGDSTGNNRMVGIGGNITQYSMIEENLFKYLVGSWKRVPSVNYPNKYRLSFLNRIMAGLVPGVMLVVDPECTNLIGDFDNIKEGPDGCKIKEKVKDENGNLYEKWGHCFVGETKIITDNGEVEISKIKVGDKVLTRNGYQKVLNVYDNGLREVYDFNISGNILRCTNDHKVYTENKGFIKIKDATRSDMFCIFDKQINKISLWKERKTEAQYKQLTGLDLYYQREKSITKGGVESTEKGAKQQLIVMYGANTMGLLRKDFTYTIKTKTSQTTILKTLKHSTQKNTLNTIFVKKGKKKLQKYLMKKQDQKLLSGINQKKVENGIENKRTEVFLKQKELGSVFCVAKPLLLDQTLKSIVQKNARQKLITTSVLQKKRVYDLKIENNNEYFANNVLVHNCSDAFEYGITYYCKNFLNLEIK